MKKKIPLPTIVLSCLLLAVMAAQAQTKYYRIREHIAAVGPNWRDTLFVVKVSDTAVQADFAQELSISWSLRTKIVNGTVHEGDGGFNRNGTHCFSWHFDERTIHLTDVAAEVCDGWPYQDCELADFVSSPGHFCPWSMKVWDEISTYETCSLTDSDPDLKYGINVFPNPATDKIKIEIEGVSVKTMYVSVFDQIGNLVYYRSEGYKIDEISLEGLATGVYSLVINADERIKRQKIVKK